MMPSQSKPASKKAVGVQPTSSDSESESVSCDELSSSASSQEGQTTSHSGMKDKDITPVFTLSCLRNWDTEKMDKSFQDYVSKLQQKSAESSQKVGVPKISKIEDFTPWWDDFSKPKGTTSKPSTTLSKDPDSFDNWFAKGSNEGTSSSWLSDSGPLEKPKSTAQVEDIEVPSIYDQKPKTKGRRALKKERKAEREKTMGKNWFDMRAPEVDDKLRNDLEMIRMRGVLDPKRFYKHNDRRAQPKYFQVGSVEDEGTDFYSSRLTKKQRKETLVEELLADANVRQYNKRKYSEVQQKMRSKKKFQGKKSATS